MARKIHYLMAAIALFLLAGCGSDDTTEASTACAHENVLICHWQAADEWQRQPTTERLYFSRFLEERRLAEPQVLTNAGATSFDTCLADRSALTICRYQLAAELPCVGPPGDGAGLVGVISPRTETVLRVTDGDVAGLAELALCELIQDTERRVIEESHDIDVDDMSQRRNRFNQLGELTGDSWHETPLGQDFITRFGELGRTRPNVAHRVAQDLPTPVRIRIPRF